jgi:hypothetical protein
MILCRDFLLLLSGSFRTSPITRLRVSKVKAGLLRG